ncbi:uncharacterized protein ACLA_032720 [Aspergillus clavatus NRRL 1]|uniref:DUF6314 domain-containing protein n=1 Tax=Aspergillus clavatus (strain ATCC 1007 / CBS 513.65 / DSM 816 / NCTC 3887 / NRRL 1 / QM 1276 / 107) TaxID=344612 RepID=A1CSB5_ASPCL|nr:uncharacterized protein ACLA_032720 [Aspergillus clavatus NRRL 1]EAW08536.1 conserved hypothetical protein [Aspergillus clavatus NRRL 1]
MTQPQPPIASCPLTTQRAPDMPARPATLPHRLTGIFTSLSHNNRRWSLLRTLQSDNPLDINGELRGTATFTPLRRRRRRPATEDKPHEMLYREEGELPNTFGMGLRWTKKYIWQRGEQGAISVWFVKVKPSARRQGAATTAEEEEEKEEEEEDEDEADYLFHDFDFEVEAEPEPEADGEGETFVAPPAPPAVAEGDQGETDVVLARGNHLCINDMYRTAYAFRIRRASGEVVSWSSRHVVKGPKKNQDIVNLYRLEE